MIQGKFRILKIKIKMWNRRFQLKVI